MKTASAKAKGRRASQELKKALLEKCPDLEEDDIVVQASGVTGEDLLLSPKARKEFPFTFEVKNQERISIWACLEQSESHASKTNYTPILAFRKNNKEMHVCLKLKDFLKLLP